jgi:hypothetical protein
MSFSPPHPGPSYGDGLLHPVPMAAVLLLLWNDHIGKAWAAGTPWSVVTGKLSDVAGLLFFPLLLVALGEVVSRRLWSASSVRLVLVTVAIAFAAIKVWPPAADAYRSTWGLLRFPLDAALAAWRGGQASWRPVRLWMDASDLLALPALWASWWLAKQRLRSRS